MYFGHGVYGVAGGVAAVLRQGGEGSDARRGGAHRRHPPGQRPAEPLRQHGRGAAAPQLRARPDGRRRLHHAGRGGRRRARSRSSLRGEPPAQPSVAPYFLEEVRKELEARYGAKQLYENGLVDPDGARRPAAGSGQPRAGRRAAAHRQAPGLPQAAAQRRRRRPRRRRPSSIARWDRPMRDGDVVPAVVRIGGRRRRSTRAPGTLRVTIDRKGFAWTAKTAARSWSSAGDLIEVRLADASTTAAHTASGTLEQPPTVEGAILAIDNRTGQIKAMVGGYSFERSKFNRATQALRQVGSAFKPIVYTAAIDRGYTPASLIVDAPVSFSGRRRTSRPTHRRTTTTSSRGRSRCATRSRIAQRPGGPADGSARPEAGHRLRAAARARRRRCRPTCRSRSAPPKRRCSEMTSAYSVFPNQGVHMQPYSVLKVTDRDGQRARREPAGAEGRHPRRHRVRHDQPAARRRAARHGREGGVAQLADRRQDRHDRRLHRRLVRRVRSGHHASACGSASTRRSRSATT